MTEDIDGGNRDLFDRALFEQDLDEVYLLLDHISGRTDKSLDGLKITLLARDGTPREMESAEFIAEITLLRYPPPGNEVERSRAAANVIKAKDRLSALAAPARGVTIAYTTMFVGGRLWRGGTPDSSRFALAARAFPAYQGHAATFARMTLCFLILTLGSLLLVAMTHWDVAYGRLVLQRIELLNKEQTALLVANPGVTAQRCRQPEGATSPIACDEFNRIDKARGIAIADTDRFSRRAWSDCATDISFLCTAMASWNTADAKELSMSANFLGSLLDIFTSLVLPVLFAMLGTLVRTFRDIREKIGESVLAPRDRMLALINLPMGFIAGLAVGLFFAPSPTQAAIQAAAIPVALTSSGVGFLAGYGAESFFTLLDAVLKRVFNLENGKKTP